MTRPSKYRCAAARVASLQGGLAVLLALPAAAWAEVPETQGTSRIGGLETGPLARDAAREAREDLGDNYPRFSYGFAAELENDYTFAGDGPGGEVNDLFPTLEGALALEIAEGTGVFSTLVMEPVFDPVGNRAFGDVGLFVEELYGAASIGGFSLQAGKFNPAFGGAFEFAPGIFGTSFAEDYELTERLGGSVGLTIEALGGEHALTAALFMADRTALSGSVFDERGELGRADGGASNTGGPKSFSLAATGEVGTLNYNAGFRFQSGGRGAVSDEVGFVVGVDYADIRMGGGALQLLAEGAFLANADGGPADVFIGTVGGAYAFDDFTLSAVYALRDTSGPEGQTDHLLTTTAEYELLEGLTGAIGYAYGREGGEETHTLGLLISFEFGGGYSF